MSSINGNNIPAVIPEAALIPESEVKARIDTMLANRAHMIERVKPLLLEEVDIYTLPGMKKPSLGKPGAEKLAAIFGLSAAFILDRETMDAIRRGPDEKQYVAYVCNLTRHGEFAGQGRGAAFVEWERTQYRNSNVAEYAAAKTLPWFIPGDWQEKKGQYGNYYRVKDGTVFDHLALNKSIKMAQKSAFVDAVIRTTGMSDLFTQDVENEVLDVPEPKNMPVAGVKSEDDPFAAAPTPTSAPPQEPIVYCDIAGCGGTMTKRNGARGPFLGCSNFNHGCRNTISI